MASHPESHLQQVCVRWFRLAHRDLSPLYFAVPNGQHLSMSQARIAVAEGLTKGVADTLLLVPRKGFHGLCIEYKTEREVWKGGKRTLTRTYQEPEQREWQKAVEGQGYRYTIVRTFDEFEKTIEEYLND